MIPKRGCHPSPNSTCMAHLAATTQTRSCFECLPQSKKNGTPLQQNLCHHRAVSGAFLHALRFQTTPSSDSMKWSPLGVNRLCQQMLSRRLDAVAAATHWYTFHSHSSVAELEGGGADTKGTGFVNLTVSHAEKIGITVWLLLSSRHFR